MSLDAHIPLRRPVAPSAMSVVIRRPYLPLSIAMHAVMLTLLYYFASYQPAVRQQEAEVASSLRAASRASTAERLQNLETIKELLEKSAERFESQPEVNEAPASTPKTPAEMVEQARELSTAIEELDEAIKAAELAELTGVPEPEPPVAEEEAPPGAAAPMAEPAGESASSSHGLEEKTSEGRLGAGSPAAVQSASHDQSPVTEEMAEREVSALESKARARLAKRQQRLEAKANGVPIEWRRRGAGRDDDAIGTFAAPPVREPGADGVRAEIADFLADKERIEQTMQRRQYAGRNLNFFDRGLGQIPPVDVNSVVLGRGRVFGAGGDYANRVYLNTWYIIGPFPGRHEAGLFDNPSYPPEKIVQLDAVYLGKDKRALKWRYVTAQGYPLVPPDLVEDSVYYGYTEVHMDQASDLVAWIGADDDVQIYLNDRLVWQGGNIDKQSFFDAVFDPGSTLLRDYNRTEGRRVLHFKEGSNKIFFKLSNGPNAAFLSFVLTRE
jgi:hypothetical protein